MLVFVCIILALPCKVCCGKGAPGSAVQPHGLRSFLSYGSIEFTLTVIVHLHFQGGSPARVSSLPSSVSGTCAMPSVHQALVLS